jgi:hypothetical protein
MKSFIAGIFFAGMGIMLPSFALAALSCSVTTATACTNPSVIAIRLSSSANAHAELPSGSNAAYASNVICCAGGTSLGTSCSGTFASLGHLSAATNAHFEENTFSNFANNVCLSVGAGSISVGYQTSNCTGYDATIASISSTSNAHVGSPAVYSTKICGTVGVPPQTLTFALSANTIGFGSLSASASRYATSDTLGSGTETAAHAVTASTNAVSGYTISVQGSTLASGANSISALGATNSGLSPGTSQFGLRATATGGSGTVSSPYAASGFAYAGVSSPSTVASELAGDGVSTTYSMRYAANISPLTPSGTYATVLTYTITANF